MSFVMMSMLNLRCCICVSELMSVDSTVECTGQRSREQRLRVESGDISLASRVQARPHPLTPMLHKRTEERNLYSFCNLVCMYSGNISGIEMSMHGSHKWIFMNPSIQLSSRSVCQDEQFRYFDMTIYDMYQSCNHDYEDDEDVDWYIRFQNFKMGTTQHQQQHLKTNAGLWWLIWKSLLVSFYEITTIGSNKKGSLN